MGFGTEIWDITGESVIVVEPYEHVDKLLNPPVPGYNDYLASQAQTAVKAPEPAPAPRVPPPAPEAPKTPEKRTEPHKAAAPRVEDKPRETAKTTS